MLIELSMAEIQVASMVGVQRQIEDIKWKNDPKYGATTDSSWQMHIEGALAECAFAKYKNGYWNKRDWHYPDVGDDDVRCTPYATGHLWLYEKDDDNRKYYLLTGQLGKYTVRGYILGKDAKQQKYWKSMKDGRPPQFWIPQTDLKHD